MSKNNDVPISTGNYSMVYSWMSKVLGLKPLDIIIFSIIHNYSLTNNKQGNFYGTIDTLVELTNTSRTTVEESLKRLVSKEYVIKTECTPLSLINFTSTSKGFIHRYTYKTNFAKLKSLGINVDTTC